MNTPKEVAHTRSHLMECIRRDYSEAGAKVTNLLNLQDIGGLGSVASALDRFTGQSEKPIFSRDWTY